MSQVFTNIPGRFVNLPESIQGFRALLSGEGDDYPEASFYMVGNLEEAFEKGRKITAEVTKH